MIIYYPKLFLRSSKKKRAFPIINSIEKHYTRYLLSSRNLVPRFLAIINLSGYLMVKTVLLKKCSLRRYLKNCQPFGKFMCVIKIFLCVTKVIPYNNEHTPNPEIYCLGGGGKFQ